MTTFNHYLTRAMDDKHGSYVDLRFVGGKFAASEREMQLGQLKMIITLSKKLSKSPVTYKPIDNLITFPLQPTFLNSDLRVKIYAHLIKGLSNRPS